jgi:hypothetical protein
MQALELNVCKSKWRSHQTLIAYPADETRRLMRSSLVTTPINFRLGSTTAARPSLAARSR